MTHRHVDVTMMIIMIVMVTIITIIVDIISMFVVIITIEYLQLELAHEGSSNNGIWRYIRW